MILQRKEVVSMDTITTIMVTWPHQSDIQSLTLIETGRNLKSDLLYSYHHFAWKIPENSNKKLQSELLDTLSNLNESAESFNDFKEELGDLLLQILLHSERHAPS